MTCCLEQRLPPDVSPSLESLEGQGRSSECHKETRLLPDVPEYTHWIPLPRCPLSTDWFSFLVWKGSLPHTPRGVPGHPGHGVPWPQLRKPHCREAEREISSSEGFSLLGNFNRVGQAWRGEAAWATGSERQGYLGWAPVWVSQVTQGPGRWADCQPAKLWALGVSPSQMLSDKLKAVEPH